MNEILRTIVEDPGFPEGTAWVRNHYEANQTVVNEGERGRSVYFVEAGELRVSRRVALDDQRHIRPGLCDLGSGDIFGELGLFGSELRTATVTTLTPARILVLDGSELSRYLDSHPQQGYLFLRAVIERLVGRLRHTNLRVDHLLAWGLKVHGIDEHL